jgi:muconate/chloromuconate cycloisomerase
VIRCKIKNVETAAIDLPLKKQWKISLYKAATRAHAVVKITTEEGITGYGEVAPSPAFMGETGHTVALVIENYLKSVLVGKSAFDIEMLHREMKFAIYGNLAAKSAVDMALYDIMGKALDMPVRDLLGGSYRDRIDLSWVVGMQDLDGSIDEAQDAVAKGYRTIKLKVGISPEVDYELVSGVRKALGDKTPIRLDANQGYDYKTAFALFSRLEEFHLESIEQPVERWDLHGMAELRRRLRTPIMADESVSTPHDALDVIATRAADCVNIKVGKVGGLWKAKKIADSLEAAGLSATAGSNLEVGIGSAASIHFVASTEVVDMPNDLLLGGPLHEYDLIEGDFSVNDGQVTCPATPGLGITVDESLFRKNFK